MVDRRNALPVNCFICKPVFHRSDPMSNHIEIKLKHLEFVQAAINRMANNSFLLKGWAVTLTGGLFALTFKESDRRYLYISLVVLALFWLLDSYYLSRERGFIRLYNHVRTNPVEKIDFSMDARNFGKRFGWFRCAFSRTMLLFYGGLLVVHVVIKFVS